MDKILDAVKFIKEKVKTEPEIGIILGSGLGNFGEFIEEKEIVEYKEIPGFPVSTVSGHKGRLIFGKIGMKSVVAMQGRIHYYEGYTMKEVAFPVFLMNSLGIKKLIVSNAAGGINKTFEPGTLMIINDHINLMGNNPLIGKNNERYGPRFPDMSEPYKKYLIEKAKECAGRISIKYREGVYAAVTGPYYETAAEIRYLSVIGADAVGMSTAPEVIAANYLGMDVLGISCITNMATGIAKEKHSHEKVVEIAKKAEENFSEWVMEIIKNI